MRHLSGLAASLLGLVATSAWADGMPQAPQEPPCCNGAPFAGPYIGAAVGFNPRKVSVDNETLGTSFSDETQGAMLGVYVGYNWQHCCGRYVVGVEADFDPFGPSPTAYDIEVGPTGLHETTALKSSMDWFGTVRGRLGYVVHEDLLLYASGGLAVGRVKHTLSDDCVGCGNTAFNFGSFSQSDTDTKVGWIVGGGAELVHDLRWLFRVEAFYVDFGSSDHFYLITSPLGTADAATKWHDELWLARIGAAYRFDWQH